MGGFRSLKPELVELCPQINRLISKKTLHSVLYLFMLSFWKTCGVDDLSLAVGAFGLAAGIPAPIYFGAIIDTTCLKWGQKRCGGIGACRIYNTTAYR